MHGLWIDHAVSSFGKCADVLIVRRRFGMSRRSELPRFVLAPAAEFQLSSALRSLDDRVNPLSFRAFIRSVRVRFRSSVGLVCVHVRLRLRAWRRGVCA
jgi:hypothetical protein